MDEFFSKNAVALLDEEGLLEVEFVAEDKFIEGVDKRKRIAYEDLLYDRVHVESDFAVVTIDEFCQYF